MRMHLIDLTSEAQEDLIQARIFQLAKALTGNGYTFTDKQYENLARHDLKEIEVNVCC